MDYDQLWNIGERAKDGTRLTPGEKRFVKEIVPRELAEFPKVPFPSRVRHPAGFSISGAPVRTLVRCVLVLSAQRVLGLRYDARSEFYERVAADLAFGIMRSHFHHGYPKGVHCCAQCTLAVFPVLKRKVVRLLESPKRCPQIDRSQGVAILFIHQSADARVGTRMKKKARRCSEPSTLLYLLDNAQPCVQNAESLILCLVRRPGKH